MDLGKKIRQLRFKAGLTQEQRLNRIENRMVAEEELPADISREFESFLQAELNDAKH